MVQIHHFLAPLRNERKKNFEAVLRAYVRIVNGIKTIINRKIKKISSRVLSSKSKLNKGKKNLFHSLIIFFLFLPPSYSFFCEMGSKCCHSMRNNKIPSSTHTFSTFTFQFLSLFFSSKRSHHPSSSHIRKIVNFKHTTGYTRGWSIMSKERQQQKR